jgi:cytochrome P450
MPLLTSALDGHTLATALTVLGVVYIASVIIYRRFIHPLSKIPGPFLPAVTTLYQSYYNRRYYLKIEELHKKYGEYRSQTLFQGYGYLTESPGPVVRILPNEIHLADPQNFEKIYYVGSKYTKGKDFYLAFTIPNSTFSTITNDVHRVKRSRLNPMFSRKMVLELEEIVQDKAHKLVSITDKCIESGEAVDLHHMFRCVSVDVITEYSFDKSYDLLDVPDFGAHFFKMVRGIGPAFWAFQQFPGLVKYIRAIPPHITKHFGGVMNQVIGLQQEGVVQLNEVKARMKAGTFTTDRPTIFSELLDPEKQGGYPVPEVDQLKDEVYSVLAAAADTTGNAMTVACYKVLKNPEIYAALRKELLETFPNPNAKLEFTKLEKLPYLTGVVKEGIR